MPYVTIVKLHMLLSKLCVFLNKSRTLVLFCPLTFSNLSQYIRSMEGSTSASGDINFNPNEFNEATCPICMDHPHNAVLLICSSHEKGCRSFICDSSSRHSNCLERFKSLSEATPSESGSSVEGVFRSPNEENNSLISVGEELDRNFEAQVDERVSLEESSSQMNLKCPLCRGDVLGWMIVKEARDYLDLKLRSCALDSCTFSGNYEELRRHARREHPMTRPADVDPTRQHAWRRLERQQERSDILSAIRSAVPEAVVLGDYVLDPASGHQEHGDVLSAIRSAATAPGAVVLGDYVLDIEHGPTDDENGHLWSTFFLFHVIRRPSGTLDERTSSRIWSRRIRSSSRHRNLWGENLLGLQDEDDDEDGDEELGVVADSRLVRRHRRVTSSRSLVGDGDDLNEDDDVSLPRRRRRRRRLNEDDDLSLPDDEQT